MKRRGAHINQVDAILTSDWHLREDTPVCRTDNFWGVQWDKVLQVNELQLQYSCPVFHSGDLLHHWKPSPLLLSQAIRSLPDRFFTVYGQHDLPQHNWELKYKSGIETLELSGRAIVIPGSWGSDLALSYKIEGRKIALWHKFVWDGENLPWPGCEGMTAEEVLDAYPEFDLIVTGDHHKPFVFEKDGRVLVNPGCLTRQTADYEDHRPRVYLWDAKENVVVPRYLNVEGGVVSRDHIEAQQKRDARIDAFVNRLNTDWKLSISFEENLTRFFSTNKVRKTVEQLTYKAIENE